MSKSMRKTICFIAFWITMGLLSHGQRNEVAVYSVGNFNSANYIYLKLFGDTPVASSNKSSVGCGIEYRRWLTPYISLGPWVEENSSDGKLLPLTPTPGIHGVGGLSIWPMRRYEAAALTTFQLRRQWGVSPFFTGGPGVIVTESTVPMSGWSADPAIFAGTGIDYQISKHWASRASMMVLDSATGCYNDPTCTTLHSWAIIQDLRAGLAYRW